MGGPCRAWSGPEAEIYYVVQCASVAMSRDTTPQNSVQGDTDRQVRHALGTKSNATAATATFCQGQVENARPTSGSAPRTDSQTEHDTQRPSCWERARSGQGAVGEHTLTIRGPGTTIKKGSRNNNRCMGRGIMTVSYTPGQNTGLAVGFG